MGDEQEGLVAFKVTDAIECRDTKRAPATDGSVGMHGYRIRWSDTFVTVDGHR